MRLWSLYYECTKTFVGNLEETSKCIGCSLHIQQPAAAKLHSKSYASLFVAAALWLYLGIVTSPLICDVYLVKYASINEGLA